MNKLLVQNESSTTLTLVIEPLAESYEVLPGTKASITGRFTDFQPEFGEIIVGENNHLTVWTSIDAVVKQEGKMRGHK